MTAAPQNILIIARDARLRRVLIDSLDDHERWQLQPLVSIAELSSADPSSGGVTLIDVNAARRAHEDNPKELLDTFLGLRVIVVGEAISVGEAVQWMRRGAWDVVDLADPDPTLAQRVAEAFQADEDLSTEQAAMARTRTRLSRLTPRERQLLDAVIVGRSNKQIAADWSVSERTVANHRANLLEKMRAVNTADLVRMAVEVRQNPLSQFLSARSHA